MDPAAPTPPLGTNAPPPAPGHTVVVPVAEVQTQLVDTPGVHGDHPTTPPEPGPPRPPANLASTEAEPRRQPDRRRRRWPWVVLLLTALIGGSALGGYLLWDRVLAPVTPIPSVLGAPGSNAAEQLERAGFLPQILDRTVHDLGVPEGHVLTQEPQGDARTGTQVRLVLSAGPRQVMVPEVDGIPADDAVATLAAADLGAVVTEVHHERVPEGRVIGTDPPPGEEVDEGTEVAVTVSLGPTPIAVPEVVGSDLAQARTLVRDAGLELTIAERRYDAAVPVDQVLAQDPAPGGIRYAGDVVEVVISDGPEPVVLPNVRGERVADAVATLEALGLEVEVERRGGFSAFFNPDRVYDQDPGPGSSRLPGETVLLYAYEP